MAIYGIESNYLGSWIPEEIIREAKAGNVGFARLILHDFVAVVRENTVGGSIENGHPLRTTSGIETRLDERVVRYLAEAFQQILEGVPADKALGTKPGTGGRPKLGAARDRSIALDVAVKIKEGKSAGGACAEVAENYRFKDESTVRKLYKAHKSTVDKVATFLVERNKPRS